MYKVATEMYYNHKEVIARTKKTILINTVLGEKVKVEKRTQSKNKTKKQSFTKVAKI